MIGIGRQSDHVRWKISRLWLKLLHTCLPPCLCLSVRSFIDSALVHAALAVVQHCYPSTTRLVYLSLPKVSMRPAFAYWDPEGPQRKSGKQESP